MDYSRYWFVSTLLAAAKPRRTYHFDQGQDWVNVRSHGGVCDAVTLDWVRRKAFNKRGFGDAKYQTGWIWNGTGRRKLGAKHVLLSDLFREEAATAVRNAPRSLFRQGAADVQTQAYEGFVRRFHADEGRRGRKEAKGILEIGSGFERMRMVCPGSADGLGAREARAEAVGALSNGEGIPEARDLPWWGLMIALLPSQEGSGHAVGLFHRAGAWAFFDPNHGEYDFAADRDDLVSFVTSLWCLRYNEYSTVIPRYLLPVAG